MFLSLVGIYISALHFVGLGGGFKENDDIEYVRRDDSDSEYDEVCFLSLILDYLPF